MIPIPWSSTTTTDGTITGSAATLQPGASITGDMVSHVDKYATSIGIVAVSGKPFSPDHILIGFLQDIDGVKSETPSLRRLVNINDPSAGEVGNVVPIGPRLTVNPVTTFNRVYVLRSEDYSAFQVYLCNNTPQPVTFIVNYRQA